MDAWILMYVINYRLCGILHVLYSAIKKHLPSPLSDATSEETESATFSRVIPKEIAANAVALTEYFQLQRRIYEDVSSNKNYNKVSCILNN